MHYWHSIVGLLYCRLFQLLDGDNTQKLFRTYSGLESVAAKLAQEIYTVKNQLAVCEQEQSHLLSKLEADMKSLQDFMYPDGSELILQTPVSYKNRKDFIKWLWYTYHV